MYQLSPNVYFIIQCVSFLYGYSIFQFHVDFVIILKFNI